MGARTARVQPRERFPWRMALLLIAAGSIAYANSLSVPFLFDDKTNILENARFQQLWPLEDVLRDTTRPVTDLSFAINYALGGPSVRGYHVVNLAVHLLAALVLFGLVFRTLRRFDSRPEHGQRARWQAFAVALLWLLHPLQTESVTYIVQRAEALMGLCFLLTLYCVARGAESPHGKGGYLLAVIACALGMWSKPVMVAAPLVALLYDRAFLARSWREVWRERWALHAGLAATWLLLVVAPSGHETYETTAGFGVKLFSSGSYMLTQLGVIAHYLRLAVWPAGLVFDYSWLPVTSFEEVLLPSLLIGALIAATIWVWRRHPALGFVGAW